MKKIISFLLLSLILALPFCVVANAETDTSLKVEYTFDETNGNIYINASFIDVKINSGIIYAIYDIKYNANELELVKAETVMPESWSSLLDSGMVEDMSRNYATGVYRWEIGIFTTNKGIVNNNELGLKLEFKPKTNGTTSIKLDYYDLITEVVKNGMTEDLYSISGESVNLEIDLNTPNAPVIEESAVLPESVYVSEGDPGNNETSASDQSEPDTSSSNSVPSGNVSMPSVITESDNSEDTLSDSSSTMIWVIVGIGVICIVTIISVFATSKKGKK